VGPMLGVDVSKKENKFLSPVSNRNLDRQARSPTATESALPRLHKFWYNHPKNTGQSFK